MRETNIHCDAPGCEVSAPLTNRRDCLEGWLTRTVTDSVKKTLPAGVHDFDAPFVTHFCPAHRDTVSSPPLHPEVAKFLAQPQE